MRKGLWSKALFSAWAYIGWFCCVLAGKHQGGLTVLLIPAFTWIFFIFAMRPGRSTCRKLLLIAGFGLAFDTLALSLKWVLPIPASPHFPIWLGALWLHFVPSLNLLQAYLERRLFLAAFAGGLLGPLSYYSGESFGVLSFSSSWVIFAYSAFWFAFLPAAIFWLRENPRNLSRERFPTN